MSKRDDDSADLEVGMTTAERRRRRRRGGGLRVPSDNVPRRTTPPVVAPVPEDPALAMSIAYSFSSEASEPVPRVSVDSAAGSFHDASDPVAPEPMATMIDPPSSPVEQQDFEMKTREMSAVDLEALGLSETSGIPGISGSFARAVSQDGSSSSATNAGLPVVRFQRGDTPATDDIDDLEVSTLEDDDDDDGSADSDSVRTVEVSAQAPDGPRAERPRTVALSDDDLEEVRESLRAQTQSTSSAHPHAMQAQPGTGTPVPRAQTPSTSPVQVQPSHAHTPSTSPFQVQPSRTQTPTMNPVQVQPSRTQTPASPVQSQPAIPTPRSHTPTQPPRTQTQPQAPVQSSRAQTQPQAPVQSSRAQTQPLHPAPAPIREPAPEAAAPVPAPAATPAGPASNRTQPLSVLDITMIDKADEGLSAPEIDISDLAERAESSGEFEVDVEDDAEVKDAAGSAMAPSASSPVAIAAASAAAPTESRGRSPSLPPPNAPAAGTPHPGVSPAHAQQPPPPPPAAHHSKAPPTPPPAKKDKPVSTAPAPIATAPTKNDGKLDPKRGKPWFVDLFDEDYLRTLPFLTPQATQAEAEFVINAMGLSPGAQVLDVGCGYGRHAMELAARGFHVVGLDSSTPLLIRGGEEAHRRGLQINFVRGDMRELDFEAQFDGAYCLFSTFGYFDDETNKKTIAHIARALKPGGRLMIEILNRDYVITDLPTRVWWEGEGCVVLEEVELNYFSSRIQVNRSVVFDDGRQLEQEISVRAYSLHEIGKLMHAAGFRVLEVSGGYHTRGRFFGNQSRHIIVLAERKDTSGT